MPRRCSSGPGRLDAAKPTRRRRGAVPMPLNGPVDDGSIEPERGGGELAAHSEELVVDVVDHHLLNEPCKAMPGRAGR